MLKGLQITDKSKSYSIKATKRNPLPFHDVHVIHTNTQWHQTRIYRNIYGNILNVRIVDSFFFFLLASIKYEHRNRKSHYYIYVANATETQTKAKPSWNVDCTANEIKYNRRKKNNQENYWQNCLDGIVTELVCVYVNE